MPTFTRACIALLLSSGVLSATMRPNEPVKRFSFVSSFIDNVLFAGCTDLQIVTLRGYLSAQRQAFYYAGVDLAGQPAQSTSGFSLFFNTQRNVAKVQTVINSLLDTKFKTFDHPSYPGPNPSPPQLVCLPPYDEDPNIRGYIDACNGLPGQTGIAFYAIGSPYIFLCPQFWNQPSQYLTSKTDCPKASWWFSNRFSANEKLLFESQYNSLLHELIHWHLYPTSFLQPEIYPLNDCIALPAEQSVINPQNYAYYIMGFTAGCTYPLRQPDPSSGRELLGSGVEIKTDTIGILLFNLTTSNPPPPGQLGPVIPAFASDYTNAILSIPPPPSVVINATYASASVPMTRSKHVVGVTLTDISENPGPGSCFNQLLHGLYVEDLNVFVSYALDPIYGGNWTATGIVKNVTDPRTAPVNCMLITATVDLGPGK